MLDTLGNSEGFEAFFTVSGLGATGLTVTVNVRNPAGTLIVTGASATEVGDGFYTYSLSSSLTTTAGTYRAIFMTAGTADQKHQPSVWILGKAWVASHSAATGTAQAGAVSTITLASGTSATDNLHKGSVVFIYGGTGAGQSRVITGYVGSTKVATVGRAWATNPDNTSLYIVVPLPTPVLDANLGVTANVTQWLGTTPNVLQTGRVDTYLGAVATGLGTPLDDIAAATWDLATSGHTTSGSFGAAMNAAGSAGDPWATSLPGSYGSGTAGKIVGDGVVTLASDGLDAVIVETGVNARQALSPILAASAGVLSGATTGTIVIKGGNVATTRITATTDTNGNRTAVTLALPT